MQVKSALAFDRKATSRTYDVNGFLHVGPSHITKEAVNGYLGREIPGCAGLGWDPDRIYQGYRPGEELEKAARTFNGLPLLLDHYEESAANPQTEHRVGSAGTECAWNAPYLDNALTITDARGIEAVESGECKELSCAYTYRPEPVSGEFDGQRYDFIMRDIQGNHIALVRDGRAGPDVVVADSQIQAMDSTQREGEQMDLNLAKTFLAIFQKLTGGGEAPPADSGPPPFGPPEEPKTDADPVSEAVAFLDTLENREAADKIKALLASLSAPPADSEEAPVPDSETEPPQGDEAAEAPAPEKAPPEDLAPAPADTDLENVKEVTGAQDKKLEAAIVGRMRERFEAAVLCEPVLGKLNPMAFDSAAAIYKTALKRQGVSTVTGDSAALRDMVLMQLRFNAAQALGSAVPGSGREPVHDPRNETWLKNFRVVSQ